jgi:hypothetical protein
MNIFTEYVIFTNSVMTNTLRFFYTFSYLHLLHLLTFQTPINIYIVQIHIFIWVNKYMDLNKFNNGNGIFIQII